MKFYAEAEEKNIRLLRFAYCNFFRKVVLSVLFLGLVIFFSGCSPRLAKAPVTTFNASAPDSLKAKFSIEVNDSIEGSHTLSAVLFAVPYKRYRMEFAGPMGVGVASVLWQDAKWTLVLSQMKSYAEGNGYLVGGYAGIPQFDIHQIAGLFWGETLSHGSTVKNTQDSGNVKVVTGENVLGFKFTAIRNANGVIEKISQGRECVEFSDYADMDGRMVPSKVNVFRDGKNVLSIKIKRVNSNVKWGDGTWKLPVPKKYEKL